MVTTEECIKIGEKYYLLTDVQKVLDQRITNVTPEDI